MKKSVTDLDRIAERIRAVEKKNVGNAIHIGLLLEEAKQHLDHGEFRSWLEAEFDFSHSTADRYRQVARLNEIHQLGGFQGSMSALYLLADPTTSDSIRKRFLKQRKPVRYADVVAALAPERAPAGETLPEPAQEPTPPTVPDLEAIERARLHAEFDRGIASLRNVAEGELAVADIHLSWVDPALLKRLSQFLDDVRRFQNGDVRGEVLRDKADRASRALN